MNYTEKIVSMEIPNFSEYIEIAKQRRAKPYVQGKGRLPKKYSNSQYHWIKKGKQFVLARVEDGLVVTSNPKTAGKPRKVKVNGQDIYNGNVSRQARATLIKAIHNYFAPYLGNIEVIKEEQGPLYLELAFLVHDQGKFNVDNDNKWPWRKAIQDTLTVLGKIPDDRIILKNTEETVFIPEDKSPSLIINIYGQQ